MYKKRRNSHRSKYHVKNRAKKVSALSNKFELEEDVYLKSVYLY